MTFGCLSNNHHHSPGNHIHKNRHHQSLVGRSHGLYNWCYHFFPLVWEQQQVLTPPPRAVQSSWYAAIGSVVTLLFVVLGSFCEKAWGVVSFVTSFSLPVVERESSSEQLGSDGGCFSNRGFGNRDTTTRMKS